MTYQVEKPLVKERVDQADKAEERLVRVFADSYGQEQGLIRMNAIIAQIERKYSENERD